MWQRLRKGLVDLGVLPPLAEPDLSAAEALAQLRKSKEQPADVESWEALVRRFHTQVQAADRARVWRRSRRKYNGTLREYAEIDQPTTDDLACMRQIVADLMR